MISLDHFVIGAVNLPAGVDYVNRLLGVTMPYGGEHEKMGTHNHLMKLGDALFLEVIAVNPDAPELNRKRWYGLDNPEVIKRITREPGLLTWVINTADIHSLLACNAYNFGMPALISRDHLSWYFGLPDDGDVFESGTLPYIMQWNSSDHPAVNMAHLNCKFRSLDLYHPNRDWLAHILKKIDALDLVTVHETDRHPYSVLTIDSPAGLKQLYSVVE